MTRRPWRLTRRQRVEMEAARNRIGPCTTITAAAILRACRLLGWQPAVSERFPDELYEWRILRARVAIALRAALRADGARVAIALRAALRADEDARCEEEIDRWERSLGSAREWPSMCEWRRVPLALWERVG